MAIETVSVPSYHRDLGGGLVVRWSATADAERLSEMYVEAFRHAKNTPPSPNLPICVRDMTGGHHPLIGPGDFALVEDTDRGRIVSAAGLLNQVWEYEGIAMPVGRPELVATDWDYRERGLVRAIFELIHARSAVRGFALGITGIPYYYREFGYEYALDQDGHRFVSFAAIPNLKDGEPESYTLRDARLDELPQVMALHNRERARGPVSTRVDEAYWRWVLARQNPEGAEGWRTQLIVDGEGRSVGYVLRARRRSAGPMRVPVMWVEPDVPLVRVLPSVMRALRAQAETMPTSLRPDIPPASQIAFVLERDHPVYETLAALLQRRSSLHLVRARARSAGAHPAGRAGA